MAQVQSGTTLMLRNRFHRRDRSDGEEKTTEELLIEKLDRFLSSIETRLDSFEQYFKIKDDEVEDEVKEDGGRSRRGSSASLSSLKSFSLANLGMIYQRLGFIKDSVLKSSVTNLEHLYQILDDQYNYLFTYNNEGVSEEREGSTNKEILSQRIITTIQYFDEKLTQVDNMIQDRTPRATVDYKAPTFRHMRFYNFNKALKRAQTNYLHYYELPLSWRENRYIIHGYRFSLKHTTMLKSIFSFNHNESMNIWTHMVGLFILLYTSLWHFPSTSVFAMNSFWDNFVVYIFLVAAISCLTCSVIWHTYSCFAKLRVRSNCACFDYTGITVLISASVISMEYCTLYFHPRVMTTYIVFSSFCGITGFIFNWSPYFDRPECRSFRIGFFVGLAVLGVTAFLYLVIFNNSLKAMKFFLPFFYKSFIWYWIGVVFYGGLLPERWRYDVIINEDETCNHSHNAEDIVKGMEHSGKEEIQEIELEFENKRHNSMPDSDSLMDREKKEELLYKEIVDKHFPEEPTKTPYYNDFLSLWWVDFYLQSHNIWHICVLFGVLGHYFTLLGMFETIKSA